MSYFTGGGTPDQQKWDTPSQLRHNRLRLWWRPGKGAGDGAEEEKGQPAGYEAETDRTQECEDNDKGEDSRSEEESRDKK